MGFSEYTKYVRIRIESVKTELNWNNSPILELCVRNRECSHIWHCASCQVYGGGGGATKYSLSNFYVKLPSFFKTGRAKILISSWIGGIYVDEKLWRRKPSRTVYFFFCLLKSYKSLVSPRAIYLCVRWLWYQTAKSQTTKILRL